MVSPSFTRLLRFQKCSCIPFILITQRESNYEYVFLKYVRLTCGIMSNLRQRKKIPRKLVDNEHVYVQDFFNIPQSKTKQMLTMITQQLKEQQEILRSTLYNQEMHTEKIPCVLAVCQVLIINSSGFPKDDRPFRHRILAICHLCAFFKGYF